MPDPTRLLATIHRAVDATRRTPGRNGRVIELQDVSEVLVAGDMHGNLASFQAIYKAAALAANPRRHLVFQEVVHSTYRYPGGGDKSHQLLDLFCALKCQHPQQVHLIMGNHEMSQWTNRRVIKNDEDYNAIFIDGVRQAYGGQADSVYAGYGDLFAVLPLVLRTPNRILLSHTVPAPKYLAKFDLKSLEAENLPAESYAPGGPAYAIVWGRDTSAGHVDQFLAKVDADWLVSGHIPCENGFAFPNEKQIILDSSVSPAAYCLLPTDKPLTHADFTATVRMI